MRKAIIFILLSLAGFGLFAQNLPFSVDYSFQPTLDFSMDTVLFPSTGGWINQKGGSISDIWEDPKNGKIYLAGEFQYTVKGKKYNGHACLHKDASLFEDFVSPTIDGGGHFFPINDSIFLSQKQGTVLLMDSLGNYDLSWTLNIYQSAPCKSPASPYFFKDGSSLWSNSIGNYNGCNPRIPPDTFPHQYLVKVDPEGFYDSTFHVETSYGNIAFSGYDSNRILMYAPTRIIVKYGKDTVNGLWRTFLDGSLDTTFNARFSDAWVGSGFERVIVENGKIFLLGWFLLEDDSTYHSLVRLNQDGSLDTTFMNHAGPVDTVYSREFVNALAPTADGGYLVAGNFNKYQGYAKSMIAKIDKYGAVESQYFNGSGFGDPFQARLGMWAAAAQIIPSMNGGFFVVGNFRSFDGNPVQPIIRLHGYNVSLKENRKEISKLTLYPNPSKENIRFESISAKEPQHAFLVDIQGKSIPVKFKSKGIHTYEVDISQLNSGMYFLKVISEGELSVGKFVKH